MRCLQRLVPEIAGKLQGLEQQTFRTSTTSKRCCLRMPRESVDRRHDIDPPELCEPILTYLKQLVCTPGIGQGPVQGDAAGLRRCRHRRAAHAPEAPAARGRAMLDAHRGRAAPA
eukprot:CAMPEP_0203928430 /NCGR_PEP_ID=MMETSP0359-20131031/67722_1 /ASSEMBLY_ACC=CAM_ASM_000338 /TAXON_ID=268821 /ORGANISM="Scrippsiella Hangoei, Strain SHTV-5" /LENGTH=114 /DNA_ID=CAMNT_0050857371 /DNA_START=145 /DNA_END=487 /DNA_ORIENTATION=-